MKSLLILKVKKPYCDFPKLASPRLGEELSLLLQNAKFKL